MWVFRPPVVVSVHQSSAGFVPVTST